MKNDLNTLKELISTKKEEYEVGVVGFAQLGNAAYPIQHKLEEAYMRKRIKELFGETPNGATLKWKGSDHDFGRYYTMYYICDPQNMEHMAFQEKVEDHDWEAYCEELQNRWEMCKSFEQFENQLKVFTI